jgi:drug/metabolite transporter (DMT)-like permease
LTRSTKAHLALLGTNIFFALNYVAIKSLVQGNFAKPFAINIIRVAITLILLWLLFLLRPTKLRIQKKDIKIFILCALLGIALNQMLFVKGLSMTFSVHAALLMLTTPILITVLAAFFLKEKLTANKLIGLLLGIAGAILLISSRKQNQVTASDPLLGDILVLINAVAYTMYMIMVKPLMQTYNPVAIIRIIFTIGFFMMLPFCIGEFREVNFADFDASAITWIFVIAVPGTFLAYLFNIYGIKVLGASTAGAYIYSQPVFASIFALYFLNETLGWLQLLAAAAIFAGVYISNKSVKNA